MSTLEERLRSTLVAEAARAPLTHPEWRGPLVDPTGGEPQRATPLRRLAVVGAAAAIVLVGAVGAAALTRNDGDERSTTASVADEPPTSASTASSAPKTANPAVSGSSGRVSCSSSGDDWRSEGNGAVVTETRSVVSFETIEVSDCASVVVRRGAPSVAVTTDANLQAQVTTTVDGSQLRIGVRGPISTTTTPRIVVTTDRLDRLQIFGAADVSVESLSGDELDLEVRGAGGVTVTGSVGKVEVDVSGSADADLSGLEVIDASVSVTGTGSVEVRASGNVRASVSGTGDVVVHGSAEIDADVDGAGEVRRSDGTVVAAGPLGGRRLTTPSSPAATPSGETPQKGGMPSPDPTPEPFDDDPAARDDVDDVLDDADRRIDEFSDAIDAFTDCVDRQLEAGNVDGLGDVCNPLLPR